MEFLQGKFGERAYHILLNRDSGEYIGVIPSCGAMLNAFNVRLPDDSYFPLIDGYENENDLVNNIAHTFKGCKLSPFPNRIKAGNYTFKGQNYQLGINLLEEGHAHHGLLYNVPFELINSGADEYEGRLRYRYVYDAFNPGYPFKYHMEIEYRFNRDNSLTCTTEIKNTDDREILIGDGWHPVFNTHPLTDDMYIRFRADKQLELHDMIPNMKFAEDGKFSDFRRIGKQQFDDAFELNNTGKAVFTLAYPKLKMAVDIWQQTGTDGYNYLQVYTPYNRNSIAVEPVTCPANAFNNGLGLITLAPGVELSLAYGIEVSFDKFSIPDTLINF
ncbi:hypothetical protein LVD17_12600 [Fulvivirga ulvae]|uniref:aldose 1-epimerase n=1 Tax=Fulvivirga ulvae TaxID=2904245 RepID=UPI001F3A1619|nr:hypothetical protein [Fulvivirga ulvae]UII34648.1 hypothetical protein LVD17_12600 [Fulvivirga ulvae]